MKASPVTEGSWGFHVMPLQAAQRVCVDAVPLNSHLGLRVVDRGPGRFTFELPYREALAKLPAPTA